MNDWDAELLHAAAAERKFFRNHTWTPYCEVRKWRTRFFLACAIIVMMLIVILATLPQVN